MSLISSMTPVQVGRSVKGSCACCGKDCWESLAMLDDAYNVWLGQCPHCNALNFLSLTHGLRGYSSAEMHLVLPTEEERDSNHLPPDCPVRPNPKGSKGPMIHGSVSGEICHQLSEGKGLGDLVNMGLAQVVEFNEDEPTCWNCDKPYNVADLRNCPHCGASNT